MVLKIGTKPGATFWLNSEPCGLICGCMTWFLLFFGMYATTAGVIVPWLGFSPFGLLNILIFNGLSLIALYSHIKVMTTDPGSVPPRARPLQDDDQEIEYAMHRDNCADPSIPFKKYCRRCKAYKPQRAHHCSICGRCIVKMDHHCPWVNNCVGVGNHKLFLLFVFWTFVTCMYSMLLVLIKYISCIGGGHKCHASSRHQLLVIFLVVESILFGLFTLCMLGDQLSAISSNQTAIDRLKGTKHNYQMEINEVCGSARNIKFHHSWLMPVPVRFPDGVVKDKILGYRLSRGSSSGEGEEFNPLMASTHGSVNGSSNVEEGCDQDGDIEMGMLALGQQGTEGGITSSIISSPSGGSALRKQHLLRRPSSGGDDGDVNSLNTSNDDYGNEESITEWLADAGTISTAVGGVGSGVAGGSSSHMLSGVAAAVTEMEHTTIGMSSTNSATDNQGHNDLEMTEVDLNNSNGDTVLLSSSSNNTNPSSPHAHVLLKTGAMNNNHNTTRRKRSGLA